MSNEQHALSEQELTDIDALYEPFPAFKDWPQEPPREDLWDEAHQAFLEASANASSEDLKGAQEIALRTAAFDTGAIEGLYPTDRGLTFTVATQATAWEQKVEERSADAIRLFEAQLAAFELVLDLATDRFPEVTQVWLRRVHEEVTAAQETYMVMTPVGLQAQPLPKGQYKQHPNHVRTEDGSIHAYAPVEQTQAEMQRFLDEINSVAFRDAHPLIQASYVHYALTVIHPFADGNGRLARAAASAYTYRAASIPLLVLEHQRDEYFSSLSKADAGDPNSFLTFISKVGRNGLQMLVESLRSAQDPQPESVLREFKNLYLAQADLTHEQLDEVANEFVESTMDRLKDELNNLNIPEGISIDLSAGAGVVTVTPPEGFRKVVSPGSRFIELSFSAAAPANANASAVLHVFVSTESDPATTIMVQLGATSERLTFGLSDLRPQLSSAARFRLESFLRRVLGRALSRLLEKSQERLGKLGYKP